MRILAAIGLVALAFLNAFGFYHALGARDWKGLALMVFMTLLLVFFAVTGRATKAASSPS